MCRLEPATCQTCGRPTVKNEGEFGNRKSTGRSGGRVRTGWGKKRNDGNKRQVPNARGRFLMASACCCVDRRWGVW